MAHPSPPLLERYMAAPAGMTPGEHSDVESHLRSCHLCRDYCRRLGGYSDEFTRGLALGPTERDSQVAAGILHTRRQVSSAALPPQARDAIIFLADQPARGSSSLNRWIRLHPVSRPGILTGTVTFAVIVLMAAMFTKGLFTRNGPAYARASGEFLRAYSADGRELWTRHIGRGFDARAFLEHNPVGLADSNLCTALDVDGDGVKEVISCYGWAGDNGRMNRITCFNPNGDVRWEFTLHRPLTFGSERMADEYGIQYMVAGDFRKTGRPEIIATASHLTYYPSVVLRLDAASGALLGEYWHSGSVNFLLPWQDSTGRKGFLGSGQNNGYNRAVLFFLDAAFTTGHSPAPTAYTPAGIDPGPALEYILLPESDLHSLSRSPRSHSDRIRYHSDGSFDVIVQEVEGQPFQAPILYYFDRLVRCSRVDGTDPFVFQHRVYETTHPAAMPIGPAYYDSLQRGLLYWNGREFTTRTPGV